MVGKMRSRADLVRIDQMALDQLRKLGLMKMSEQVRIFAQRKRQKGPALWD